MSNIDNLFPDLQKKDDLPHALYKRGMSTGLVVNYNPSEQSELVEQKVVFAIIRPDMRLIEGLPDHRGDMHSFVENNSGVPIRVRIEIIGSATKIEQEEWETECPVLDITTWAKVKSKVNPMDNLSQQELDTLNSLLEKKEI